MLRFSSYNAVSAVLLIAMLLGGGACKTKRDLPVSDSAVAPLYQENFIGYNVAGEASSCAVHQVQIICGPETAEVQSFKTLCLQKKAKIVQCDCDVYLCGVKVLVP